MRIQCKALSVKHSVSKIQCKAFGVKHSVSRIPFKVVSVKHSVSSAENSGYGQQDSSQPAGLYLTESVYEVVLQKSVPAEIRPLILYVSNNEG